MRFYVFVSLALSLITMNARAQEGLEQLYIREVHIINGMGWGFPLGRTSEVLSPKYSTNTSIYVSLKNKNFYLLPSMDFLAFNYNQKKADPDFTYLLEKGRSNFYVINLSAGARKSIGHWGFSGYFGPGGALITEPRAELDQSVATVRIRNARHLTPTIRTGANVEYKLGNFYLYLETSWLHHFTHMQDRPVNVITVYGGLKTNITVFADKVVQVFGEQANER